MDEDWAARALAEQTTDVELRDFVPDVLFHVTMKIGGIEAHGAILSRAELQSHGESADAGFGHAGSVSGERHVSLTTSEGRARNYFDVAVLLAAIAESKVAVEQWLGWYLARWDNPDKLLEDATGLARRSRTRCSMHMTGSPLKRRGERCLIFGKMPQRLSAVWL